MDNFNYSEVVQTIADVLAKKLYEKDTSDHTFKAKITEVVGGKKYKILYRGDTLSVTSSTSCEVGDFVWVCAPCNNWNNLFVVTKS